MCVPILSHNAQTNNLLLKITVPKQTGRKRKRGSKDPYAHNKEGYPSLAGAETVQIQINNLRSQARRDNPVDLLRTLKDNMDNYSVTAVAEIGQTHRYRGKSRLAGRICINSY